MARSLTLYDKDGVQHSYPVATLYYDRLAQADPDFITTCVHEADGSDPDIIPGGFIKLSERQSPSMRNLKYFVFSNPTITPSPAESDFLDGSMGDLVRPSDNVSERIVDFTNFETGERLHVGDDYSLCFGPPESFPSPPGTITTSLDYFKKYTSDGKDYYERTKQWNAPTDVFYRAKTLTNYLTTIGSETYAGNVFGCSLFIVGNYEWAFTGNDPTDMTDSYSNKNADFAAYATNDYQKGAPFSGGYTDPYTPSEYGAMSNYFVPGPSGGTFNIDISPIKMPMSSVNDPYNYEGVATQTAKILHEVSVQLVYTEIDDMPYVGLMLMRWNGDELIAMNGTFYPEFFYGITTGSGGNPDEPDPGEENDGPDADDDEGNVEGDYIITQNPPGAINADSSWLPYATTTQYDGGYHVYIIDENCVKALYSDFWGSRLDAEKLASGIVRFGMIPGTFYPIDGTTITALGITYAGYGIKVPDGADAWHINERTIVKQTSPFAHFDISTGLNRLYGNYLDFEPYTDVVLHIPFCGSIDIPPSKCIGGSIDVYYTVNVENGDIIARIRCTSASTIKTSRTKGKGETLQTDYYLRGNCFVDLPIATTSDTATKAIAASMKSIGEIGAGALMVASGMPVGGTAMVAQGISDAGSAVSVAKPSSNNAGGLVNSNLIEPKTAYIEVTRVAELADGKYKKVSGTQSFKVKTLGDITGFTKCLQILRTTLKTETEDDEKVTSNVLELSFPGSTAELSEIKRILQDGVIL